MIIHIFMAKMPFSPDKCHEFNIIDKYDINSHINKNKTISNSKQTLNSLSISVVFKLISYHLPLII